MIILPWRGVIVVATPRTGSRSIKAAIKAGAQGHESPIITGIHHEFPHEVVNAAKHGEYEIWTMTREPISQLKSWLSHASAWNDPDDFIQNYQSRYFRYEGGMNIYGRVATRFFVYENDGHNSLIKALGIKNTEVPVIGATKSGDNVLSDQQLELARIKLDYDFKLYKDVVDGKR